MQTVTFSVECFDRMLSAGVFDQPEYPRGVELIRGEIIPMSPAADPEHDHLIDRLLNWSMENTQLSEVQVRIQNSIELPTFKSVPAPDVAWVVQQDYRHSRPTPEQVLLLIEVSNSTLSYDRGAKAAVYAEAGIQDYWIVNRRDQVIEVHRQPLGDTYGEKTTVNKQGVVSPIAQPAVKLIVADLWRNA